MRTQSGEIKEREGRRGEGKAGGKKREKGNGGGGGGGGSGGGARRRSREKYGTRGDRAEGSVEMKEKRREEEVGSEEGQPGEERLVNKRMDGVDRRMLNGARGHLISSYGFYQDWLGGRGG